ncbi:hypothetical protein CBLAS_0635 [Campylobacter blaseri]|uniref:Uncharacterized protein n=1 Tax=Campylobacter blaseri TaxID=2042961 RepID=A0A2P8R202_9BACT|nr:hypothetical protein [Campylobacter blaseri]PSM52529.1 hypothetical protein CQ405_02035 [Campylobacter blaseri]PSM54177.1 hypothetical protein CRN67_02035 [Campylobacter blaseri]QKF85827.1 hypothetical protein CBLAS_0635 [Campylobacter blaseri]
MLFSKDKFFNFKKIKILIGLFSFFVAFSGLEARILPFNYFNVEYNKCMDEEIAKRYIGYNYGKEYEKARKEAYGECKKKALEICNASYFRMSNGITGFLGANLYAGNKIYKRADLPDTVPTGEEYEIYKECQNYYPKLGGYGKISQFKCLDSEYLGLASAGKTCKEVYGVTVENKFGKDFLEYIYRGEIEGCRVCKKIDENEHLVKAPGYEVIKTDWENGKTVFATPATKCASSYFPNRHNFAKQIVSDDKLNDPKLTLDEKYSCDHIIDYQDMCGDLGRLVRKEDGKCYGAAGIAERTPIPKAPMIYAFATDERITDVVVSKDRIECKICTEEKETTTTEDVFLVGEQSEKPMMEWSMACHEDGYQCDRGVGNKENPGSIKDTIKAQELKGAKFSSYNGKANQLKPRFIPNGNYPLNDYVKNLTQNVVYGDFLSTGASIIKGQFNPKNVKDKNNDSEFIQDIKHNAYKFEREYSTFFRDREKSDSIVKKEYSNSATAKLEVPTIKDKHGKILKIEGKDIVYARLYWQGMFYAANDTPSAFAQAKYADFYKEIEGYRNVAIQVGDMDPIKLTASMNDTYAAYSYSPFITNVFNQPDLIARNRVGFRMFYSASADVTDIIRENFDKSKMITVGGIKTSLPKEMWCDGSCADATNTYQEKMSSSNKVVIAQDIKNFMNRKILIISEEQRKRVTDKMLDILKEEEYLYKLRDKSKEFVKKQDDIYYMTRDYIIDLMPTYMRLSQSRRTFNDNEQITMYNFSIDKWTSEVLFPSYGGWSLFVIYNNEDKFEPKSVALYDGFTYDMTDAKTVINWTEDLEQPTDALFELEQNLYFDGLYTPDVEEKPAKIGYFLSSLASDNNSELNIKGESNNYQNVFGEIAKVGKQFMPSYTYIDYNQNKSIQKSIHIGNETPMLSVDSYDITDKLGKESRKAYLKLKTKAIGNVKQGKYLTRTEIVSPGSMFISTVAFSTDIYRPQICYVENIYNQAGVKDKFSAVRGERLNNRITFKNDSKGKNIRPAKGLAVTVFLNDKNTRYLPNSSKADNRLRYNNNEHPKRGELVYLEDGKEGAYETPLKKDKAGSVVEYGSKSEDKAYKNKKLNEFKNGDLTFYLGKGAGKISNGAVVGGVLNNQQASYVEYDTILGNRFVANSFLLNFSFEVDGKVISYRKKDNFIDRCDESDGVKDINVVSLGGLKVANQNYIVDTDDEDNSKSTLYTQVGKKDFNVTLVYEADFAHKTEELGGGNEKIYRVYSSDGKTFKDYTQEEYDKLKKAERFDPNGKLELMLVTRDRIANRGCSEITTTALDAMPFVWKNCPKDKVKRSYYQDGVLKTETVELNEGKDCNKLNHSYEVSFKNDKNPELTGKQVMITGLDIGYARKDYTFVLAYTPSGVNKKDLDGNLTKDIENYKKCLAGESIESVDCSKLKETFGNHSDLTDGSVLNAQGAFVTCRPNEVFVLRPAYFRSDLNTSKIRVAGNPNDNQDIFNRGIYPAGYDGEYLPGYYQTIQENMFGDKREHNYTSGIMPNLAGSCTAESVFAVRKDNGLTEKVWKPSNNPIFANFGILKSDGTFDETHNRIEINKELNSYENNKKISKRYATIYTGENTITGEKYFNYYNIGDANLTIYDFDWSFEDAKKADCDVNSSRSTADALGKVGCNIAVSNVSDKGENPLSTHLRFRHNDVVINLNNLKNNSSAKNYTFFSNDAESMGAKLDINASARTAENDIYEPAIVTLYNKNCYARDVNFGLDFTFDCDSNATDPRCVNVIGNSSDYKIIENSRVRKAGLLNSIIFGTDNFGKLGFIFADDEKYFVAGSKAKININSKNIARGPKRNKIPAFNLNRDSFKDNGISQASVSINFERYPNIPNNPVMLYAEDFIKNDSFIMQELPLDTDTKTIAGKPNTNGIIASSYYLNPYTRDIVKDGTRDAPINGVAYFYYGNANSENLKYIAREGTDIEPNIFSMVYCDDGVGGSECSKDDASNHFTLLRDNISTIPERPNFYINKAEEYNMGDINNFISSYNFNNSAVSINRDRTLDKSTNYAEKLTINSTKAPVSGFVKVTTNPWFVHGSSATQIENQFEIEFIPNPNSQWGGRGGTKSGDSVGVFLDSNKSDTAGSVGSIIRQNRMNW